MAGNQEVNQALDTLQEEKTTPRKTNAMACKLHGPVLGFLHGYGSK